MSWFWVVSFYDLFLGTENFFDFLQLWRKGWNRIPFLGGGLKYFLFSCLFGEIIQLNEHNFQMD